MGGEGLVVGLAWITLFVRGGKSLTEVVSCVLHAVIVFPV